MMSCKCLNQHWSLISCSSLSHIKLEKEFQSNFSFYFGFVQMKYKLPACISTLNSLLFCTVWENKKQREKYICWGNIIYIDVLHW
uniref:Uncharacterized protein n=1 Tax=Anguilla anguilla TaxID=7936 RepID=A0A0E9X4X7_ANGAN